jgi:hypothetical protein
MVSRFGMALGRWSEKTAPPIRALAPETRPLSIVDPAEGVSVAKNQVPSRLGRGRFEAFRLCRPLPPITALRSKRGAELGARVFELACIFDFSLFPTPANNSVRRDSDDSIPDAGTRF